MELKQVHVMNSFYKGGFGKGSFKEMSEELEKKGQLKLLSNSDVEKILEPQTIEVSAISTYDDPEPLDTQACIDAFDIWWQRVHTLNSSEFQVFVNHVSKTVNSSLRYRFLNLFCKEGVCIHLHKNIALQKTDILEKRHSAQDENISA